MKTKRYALGLDFGTESVRALVVDCQKGQEVGESVESYAHGVITDFLPGRDKKLPQDFALQHAQDYLDSACKAIKQVLKLISADEINGIGVDFTACTILPIDQKGRPLMFDEALQSNPHSWVKLWKHHAAQPQADRIMEVARKRGEAFLKYYSNNVSSEWMLPKCWEVAEHAPEIFDRTHLFIDGGDWITLQMTGQYTRNSCAAGYKGHWNSDMGYPSQDFLQALDPKLKNLSQKWIQNIVAPGSKAGEISSEFAALSGLKAGTPVSAATIDAHSGVAGMGVYNEGSLSIIMGTSSCHMALSRELKLFNGYAGVVCDGIIPGFYGYESGQAAVGDLFGWFAKHFMGQSFEELSQKALSIKPGGTGLVALDWMNGSRTPIMDSHLTGMILGWSLKTSPAEVYRCLIESTAFGTRAIAETHQAAGVPIRDLVVCGGLTKYPLIMQVYADVTGLPVHVAASNQTVALGAAIFGALAAGKENGGFNSLEEAIVKMTAPRIKAYEPNLEHTKLYNKVYEIYKSAADHYGRLESKMMKQLKELRVENQNPMEAGESL